MTLIDILDDCSTPRIQSLVSTLVKANNLKAKKSKQASEGMGEGERLTTATSGSIQSNLTRIGLMPYMFAGIDRVAVVFFSSRYCKFLQCCAGCNVSTGRRSFDSQLSSHASCFSAFSRKKASVLLTVNHSGEEDPTSDERQRQPNFR